MWFRFCLNVGWLYTRLLTTYTAPEGSQGSTSASTAHLNENGNDNQPSSPDEHTPLIPSMSSQLNESIETFMAMWARLLYPFYDLNWKFANWPRELHLQIKLLELQKLLAETQHEPRLKGPFPVTLYRSILTSFQAILDKLHSMRCVTTRQEW